MPCTDIAKYHKGGSAAVPAFANIRAVAAGADSVEIMSDDQIFKPRIIITTGPLHLHPVWQPSSGILIAWH